MRMWMKWIWGEFGVNLWHQLSTSKTQAKILAIKHFPQTAETKWGKNDIGPTFIVLKLFPLAVQKDTPIEWLSYAYLFPASSLSD